MKYANVTDPKEILNTTGVWKFPECPELSRVPNADVN
jgi:hypothetical protein